MPESTEEEPVSLDIVGVYAERLSAVTHAFALCCNTLQRANGRYCTCELMYMYSAIVLMAHLQLCVDIHVQ